MTDIMKNILGFKNQKIHSIANKDFEIRDLYCSDSDNDDEISSNGDEHIQNGHQNNYSNALSIWQQFIDYLTTCIKNVTYTKIKALTRWMLDYAALKVTFQISVTLISCSY